MCVEYNIHQGTGMSAALIAELMNDSYLYEYCRNKNESKNDYYCGVTNDIENNLARHDIDSYLVGYECDTAEIAAQAEELLGKMGFDIGQVGHGGNGAAEDSVYVYMYRKTEDTRE